MTPEEINHHRQLFNIWIDHTELRYKNEPAFKYDVSAEIEALSKIPLDPEHKIPLQWRAKKYFITEPPTWLYTAYLLIFFWLILLITLTCTS